MGLIIQDGTGTGNNANVNSANQLAVRGVTEGPLENASEVDGNAAFITSTYTATGGDFVLAIENGEADFDFHITRLFLSSAASQLWKLIENTGGAGGTSITYANPNLASGVQRTLTIFGNLAVSGTPAGTILGQWSTVADDTLEVFF